MFFIQIVLYVYYLIILPHYHNWYQLFFLMYFKMFTFFLFFFFILNIFSLHNKVGFISFKLEYVSIWISILIWLLVQKLASLSSPADAVFVVIIFFGVICVQVVCNECMSSIIKIAQFILNKKISYFVCSFRGICLQFSSVGIECL